MTDRQKELLNTLTEIFRSEEYSEVVERAVEQNIWFTRENVLRATDAICQKMLHEPEVEEWLSKYDIPSEFPPKTVGIVMAGNIPLVGFFDLFCVLIVGYRAVVKPSSKDSALMLFLVEKLAKRGFDVISCEKIDSESDVDMLIATGGGEAAEYFMKNFTKIPTLIRGDRHSVAVISGCETQEQLESLKEDMFLYWGLGCRNVNHLYLPVGYDLGLIPAFETNFKPFEDNKSYNRALFSIQGREFVDKRGYILINADENETRPIGVVGYSYYNSLDSINLNYDRIQCVVSNSDHNFLRNVGFGESQKPSLHDYPDSKDILKFLLN